MPHGIRSSAFYARVGRDIPPIVFRATPSYSLRGGGILVRAAGLDP